MMKSLGIKLWNSLIYIKLRFGVKQIFRNRSVKKWENQGKPVPPPHIIKQQTLKEYADKFELKILVETGTYMGDMVQALKRHFDQIYSIELSKVFFEIAKKRFSGDHNIQLIQGDSGIELEKVINKLDQPALFWLDGHYSAGATARSEKDTPIIDELRHIFNSRKEGHVIIIDDAHCFGSNPGYPNKDVLREYVYSNRPTSRIDVENNSIRITPK